MSQVISGMLDLNFFRRPIVLKFSGYLNTDPSQYCVTRAPTIKIQLVKLGPERKWMGQGDHMLFPKQHTLVQSMISDAHAARLICFSQN